MTDAMIIGIVLYLGIFIGVWKDRYLFLKYRQDDVRAFVESFFIGLVWPLIGVFLVIAWILNFLINKFGKSD